MKQISVTWIEETEYSATLTVANDFDVDDFAAVAEHLSDLAYNGKLAQAIDDEFPQGRSIQYAEEVED